MAIRINELYSQVRGLLDELPPSVRQNSNIQPNDSTVASIVISAQRLLPAEENAFSNLELEEVRPYLDYAIKRRCAGHDICNESLRNLNSKLVDQLTVTLASRPEFGNLSKDIQRQLEECTKRIVKRGLTELDMKPENWDTVYSLQDPIIQKLTNGIPDTAIALGKWKTRNSKRPQSKTVTINFADTRIREELHELLEITYGGGIEGTLTKELSGRSEYQHIPDLVSEVQKRLIRRLGNLDRENKEPLFHQEDLAGRDKSMVRYVNTVARNVCNDFIREKINRRNITESKYREEEDTNMMDRIPDPAVQVGSDPFDNMINDLDTDYEFYKVLDLIARQEILIGVVVSRKLGEGIDGRVKRPLSETIELSLIVLAIRRKRLLGMKWDDQDDQDDQDDKFWRSLVNEAFCQLSPKWSDHYHSKLPISNSMKPGVRLDNKDASEDGNFNRLLDRTQGQSTSKDQLVRDGVRGLLQKTLALAKDEFSQQSAFGESHSQLRSNGNLDRTIS